MAIKVNSEIGKLKKVLVHTPGLEMAHVAPDRIDELLYSALIHQETAAKEHQSFCKILSDNGVEVVQLVDITAETYDNASDVERTAFLNEWLNTIEPAANRQTLGSKAVEYVKKAKDSKEMIRRMIQGIFYTDLGVKEEGFAVDPIPNTFFTRDPFASVGVGITQHYMKYATRRRETVFSNFFFHCHKDYKDTPVFVKPVAGLPMEGGDVFIYNKETLVLGDSERTIIKSIQELAKSLKSNPNHGFKKIYAVTVPPMGNLMHLDTWLTMVDRNKFLYSPNMLDTLEIKKIDIATDKTETVNLTLEQMLHEIIGEKPVLIPIAGAGARKIDIDVETHFDGTNYLVIAPGVVVGYDRNVKTEAALKAAGVKVLSFSGNQLSLGMGSARCMSMPLEREDV